jgi:hypothetical protein
VPGGAAMLLRLHRAAVGLLWHAVPCGGPGQRLLLRRLSVRPISLATTTQLQELVMVRM